MTRTTHIDNADFARRYLEAIVQATADAIIVATARGTIVSWNAAARRLFGYNATEVKGKRLTLIMPRDRSGDLTRILESVRKGKRVDRFETVCVNKNEEHIHVSLTISPITDRTGTLVNSVTIVRDLTRRFYGRETILRRTRELLTFHKLSEIILSPRSLEESYHDIVQEICDATGFPIVSIATYDDARRLMVFRGLLGIPVKSNRTVLELPPKNTFSGIIMRTGKPIVESHLRDHPRYRSIVMRSVRAQTFVGYPMKVDGRFIGCLNLAHTENLEINKSTCNGSRALRTSLQFSRSGSVPRKNCTNRGSSYASCRDEPNPRLKRNENASAREIHDQLGQELSLFQLELGLIEDKLPRMQKDLRDKLKSMSALIDSSIRTVQKISADLRPTLLDNLGLGAAVEWAVKEFQKRTRIRCQVSFEPFEVKLDQERSTALFRILQETLTNVLRHARATKVNVLLVKREDAVVLTVRDNGIGIPRQRINDPKSVGLTGMRERVRPWGGKVSITAGSRKGTDITIIVPMKP